MAASAEKFSLVGDEYIGRSYQEMDCQQFAENCMKKVGITLNLAGSNAWYRKMTWTGTPEECKVRFGSIPKGALLFILTFDGGEEKRGYHDGLGNASHIGIKTGRGKGALHSSASRGCVCESEFKDKTIPNGGWNRVGLWDAFDYGDKINSLLSGEKERGDDFMAYAARVVSENGGKVNLRSKPSTGSTVLDRLPVGTMVEVTAEVDGTWSKVVCGGKTGYMMTNFLQADDGTDDITITLPRDIALMLMDQLSAAL